MPEPYPPQVRRHTLELVIGLALSWPLLRVLERGAERHERERAAEES